MSRSARPITILYADDDPGDRLLLKNAWEENRLANELHCVEDRGELMNYLRRTGKYAELSGAPLPGLILLDLDMPKKDGWEVLREIKADPLLRAIPTIVLTTSKAPQNDILRAYDLGVSSFLVKPVTLLSLVDLALALSGLSEYWLEIVELTPRGLAA